MNIHPTAIVHSSARLAPSVRVGPYSIIGENVELGEGCEVMSHAVLHGPMRAGKDNRFFPYAAIGLDPQDLKYAGEPTWVYIGDGNTLREFITVHRGTAGGEGITRIGSHNLLMAYVHIAHDCQLGSHIIMANGASLAGHVTIGDHATIGAFCGVHQFCRVGAYSFLGSYTAVNMDVLPYSKTSAPRPMSVLGANKLGLDRRGFSEEDISGLNHAFRLLCRSDLNTTQAIQAIESSGIKSGHVQALLDFIKTSERGVAK